ncbi:catechol 2,3-dioxygenase-like lactoylglutathione lyase family enzyme [Sphingobium sp. OAS761]|uniref:VOC family protein n=1 Tax=Sphingobium sp. OAS761 TaxID=2817901 RepID=UPI0020A1F3D5|nr:VOC family protein [Sphingobium sp. OAS761]MCP1471671.1 catechol 2,3-dioxygenase-like lactoylglutathione lyase family enzyme [Sphingobium sp. OAS761]
MLIKSFAFTKIIVADVKAMERFYCDTLGLTVAARIDINERGWDLEEVVLSVGGGATQLNLLQYRDRPAPPLGEAVVGLNVDDMDATIAAARAGGGALVTEPVEIPDHGIKICYVADPEGHLLELLQVIR